MVLSSTIGRGNAKLFKTNLCLCISHTTEPLSSDGLLLLYAILLTHFHSPKLSYIKMIILFLPLPRSYKIHDCPPPHPPFLVIVC